MNPRYAALIAIFLCGCTKSPTMKSINQTDTNLVINTPQFEITVPGVWTEQERPADNTIYCGRLTEGEISKQLIISGHLLVPGIADDERRKAFEDMLDYRTTTEREVTKNGATVHEEPIREYEGLLAGGYIAVHPSAARIVFSRLICDHEKAFNFYYEMWGFREKPDIQKLSEEFEAFMETAGLKSE
jgi:hypothetical protein